jgi:23S rRNA pseudouridine2605 synthase
MNKKPNGFEKFANKKKAGTIKEQFRKERRVEKKEISESINERFEERRKSRSQPSEAPAGRSTRGIHKKDTPGVNKERTHTSPTASTGKPVVSGAGHKSFPGSTGHGTPAVAGAQMPLNKFIAHCGVCARRDAATLVKAGGVTVNGKPVTEPGFKVTENDEIKLNGKKITVTKNLVYILLNKPKDYITTTEDPQERKTVMELIKTATNERVYPVGRLDRNTSGVLLFTNDGELAQTLSHPKNKVKKIYEVKLDRPLTKADFETIINGVTLEDGLVIPDALGYVDPKDKTVIGIEIHSGKNRVVRRIFEHMKYDVRGLDRVFYAGLTKKNVTRGKWRLLVEKEIRLLKHFNKDTKKEKPTK